MSRPSRVDQARLAEPVHTGSHVLHPYPEVEHFLDAFLADLDRARRRVFVETYLFRSDDFGELIGDALCRVVDRGVPVWLLYDPLGSQEADPRFFRRLQRRGLFVRSYRPRDVVATDGAPFPRDHSRNFVIDDRAYTGGVAFANDWLPASRGGGGWHDVTVGVEGPVVDDFVRLFQQRWAEADGDVRTLQDLCTRDRHPDLELVSDTPSYDSKVFNRHVAAIERARRHVHIVNSYFYPSKQMLHALYAAALRGVDVQIVTCGDSDIPIVKAAERSAVRGWLEHGLHVHEYERCNLHAKYAVVDDDWCTVGTFNANPTSVALANEVNLFVHDRAFVARIEALFQYDLRRSRKLTVHELAHRSPIQRLADYGALQMLRALDFLSGPRPSPRDSKPSR